METAPVISERSRRLLLTMQRNEITEYHIYTRLAARQKDDHNRDTLLRLAEEERAHGEIWRRYTGRDVSPMGWKIWWYTLLGRLLGITFALKLMESGEDSASGAYASLAGEIPEAGQISEDESRHENALLELLDEERLRYVGSMVLGLNDALVELTGTLAGLTFALQDTRLIALSGLITGVSATLSMASSEFLSARSDGRSDALKSCVYTGIAYCITVALLVAPYLLFTSYLAALAAMLTIVVLIILAFTYYVSVAKGLPFRRRFSEMAAISLGVAAISFLVGLLVKQFLGIDV